MAINSKQFPETNLPVYFIYGVGDDQKVPYHQVRLYICSSEIWLVEKVTFLKETILLKRTYLVHTYLLAQMINQYDGNADLLISQIWLNMTYLCFVTC